MVDTVLSDPEIINANLFIACNAKELENGISKPEHMKCEQLRFNSFKHRPFETYKGVWPSQLAKAGFYFDPRTSETVCYWCHIRIPASHWKKGTNPIIVHRSQSPNCEYITGQCKENVPFHTQSQRANRLSYLEPNSSSTQRPFGQQGRLVTDHGGGSAPPSDQVTAPTVTQESNNLSIQPRARLTPSANRPAEAQSLPIGASRDSLFAEQAQRHEPPFQSLPLMANPGALPVTPSLGSVESDHPNEVANSFRSTSSGSSNTSVPISLPSQSRNNSAPASLPYQSTNQSGGLSSRGNNRNRQREVFDGDGPDPLQRMKTEEARVMTYTRWPNHAAVLQKNLHGLGSSTPVQPTESSAHSARMCSETGSLVTIQPLNIDDTFQM